MTIDNVQNITPRVQYTAAPGQTVYPYPFPIFENTDLIVLINSTPTGAFTVTGAGNDTGGNVILNVPSIVNDIVTIYRNIPIARSTNYQQNGPLTSASLNDELDRIVAIEQQLAAAIGQSLQVPVSNTGAVSLLTPALFANKYLAFDANGNPVPAVLTSSGAITPGVIGSFLYPQTAAEALHAPVVNLFYPYGAIERYVSDLTGATDVRAALQGALTVNNRVYSATRWNVAWSLSDYVLVSANSVLEDINFNCTASTTNYAPWGANHHGAVILLNGNAAKARHLAINGNGFDTGGIGGNGFNANDVTGCYIQNCGNCQFVLHVSCTNYIVVANYFERAIQSGIEHYQCTQAVYANNHVRVCSGAGNSNLWGADSANLTIVGNQLSDCGDVGLDMEGGVDCNTAGNTVRRACNGELTWFTNGTGSGRVPQNCSFKANNCTREATYTTYNGVMEMSSMTVAGISQASSAVLTTSTGGAKNPFYVGILLLFSGVAGMTQINGLTGAVIAIGGSAGAWTATVSINSAAFTAYSSGGIVAPAVNTTNGSLFIASIFTGQKGITFDDNTFVARGSAAFSNNDLGAVDSGLVISSNKFWSDFQCHNIQRAWGMVVKDNVFHGLAGAEATQNNYKDASGGVLDNNQYIYDVTPTGVYVLQYFASFAMIASPTVSNNKFKNCGAFAFKHDASTSNVACIVFGNLFSEGYATNGGVLAVNVANALPFYRGQKLYVTTGMSASGSSVALDLSTLVSLGQGIATGKLMCIGGNALGASYSFVYNASGPTLASRDGSGTGTGIPTSAVRFATFSGTTITIAAIASNVVLGQLELDCASWL